MSELRVGYELTDKVVLEKDVQLGSWRYWLSTLSFTRKEFLNFLLFEKESGI